MLNNICLIALTVSYEDHLEKIWTLRTWENCKENSNKFIFPANNESIDLDKLMLEVNEM